MIKDKQNINKLTINNKSNIKNAVLKLNSNELKILFIVNDKNQLVGTFSDGDLRRGLLNGFVFSDSIIKIMNKKFISSNTTHLSKRAINKLHNDKISLVPILDENKRIISIYNFNAIIDSPQFQNPLLIMAGGYGKRLMPITKKIPKSMVKIGEKTMLERIINNARSQGLLNIYISIFYMANKIEKYFGDGSRFGVNIKYIKENKPLGTIGSLSFLKNKINDDLVVTNCDVLTEVNYCDILNFHKSQKSDITVAFKKHKYQNPYGVIILKNKKVINFSEKPIVESNVNAGVYVLNNKIISLMKKNSYYDFPELLNLALNKKKLISGFPVYENWIDIGNKSDLDIALKNYSDK